MERSEKRSLHLKISKLLDQYCLSCKFHSSKTSNKTCFETCNVGAELRRLSSLLVTDDNRDVQGKENSDQLKRGCWSQEEEFYLINHMDIYKIDHLAMRLCRSPKSVYSKINRLKLSKVN